MLVISATPTASGRKKGRSPLLRVAQEAMDNDNDAEYVGEERGESGQRGREGHDDEPSQKPPEVAPSSSPSTTKISIEELIVREILSTNNTHENETSATARTSSKSEDTPARPSGREKQASPESTKNNTGSTSSSASPSTKIVPTDKDVLCGRGRGVASTVGNIRYLAIIAKRRKAYQKLEKKDKLHFAKTVVYREIEELGGRFLHDDDGSGEWKLLDERRALEKICTALRKSVKKMNREKEDEKAAKKKKRKEAKKKKRKKRKMHRRKKDVSEHDDDDDDTTSDDSETETDEDDDDDDDTIAQDEAHSTSFGSGVPSLQARQSMNVRLPAKKRHRGGEQGNSISEAASFSNSPSLTPPQNGNEPRLVLFEEPHEQLTTTPGTLSLPSAGTALASLRDRQARSLLSTAGIVFPAALTGGPVAAAPSATTALLLAQPHLLQLPVLSSPPSASQVLPMASMLSGLGATTQHPHEQISSSLTDAAMSLPPHLLHAARHAAVAAGRAGLVPSPTTTPKNTTPHSSGSHLQGAAQATASASLPSASSAALLSSFLRGHHQLPTQEQHQQHKNHSRAGSSLSSSSDLGSAFPTLAQPSPSFPGATSATHQTREEEWLLPPGAHRNATCLSPSARMQVAASGANYPSCGGATGCSSIGGVPFMGHGRKGVTMKKKRSLDDSDEEDQINIDGNANSNTAMISVGVHDPSRFSDAEEDAEDH